MPEPFKSIIPTGGDFPTTPGGVWPAPAPPPVPNTVIAPDASGVWAPDDLKKALDLQYPSTVHVTHAQTSAPLDLPADQAEKAYREGAVTVDTRGIYHVKGSDGKVAIVQGGDLGRALDADPNARLVTPAEARLAQLKEQASSAGGFLKTAVQGFGRGILGGASDTWKTEQEAQEAQNLKEEHPVLSGASEAAGVLAQQALLPGGGLAGAAEETGLLGARAAGVGGEGAGFFSRAAARALPQALRAGAEGAAIGHAEAISDEALGGGPLTAEKYAGTVLSNTLWGVGLGGLGAVGSEAIGTAGRALRSAGRGLAQTVLDKAGATVTPKVVDGFAEKVFGTAAEGVGEDVLHKTALSEAAAAARNNVRVGAVTDVAEAVAKVKNAATGFEKVPGATFINQQVERTPQEISDYVTSHIHDKDVIDFINNSKKGVPDSIKFKYVTTPASAAKAEAETASRASYDAAKSAFDKLSPKDWVDLGKEVVTPAGHVTKDEISETYQTIQNYLSSAKILANEMKVPHVASAAEQATSQLEKAAKNLARVNQAEVLLKAGAGGSESMSAHLLRRGIESQQIGKGLAKGFIHTALSHGPFGAIRQEASKLTDMAAVQGAVGVFDKKIARSVTDFFRRAAKETVTTPGMLSKVAKVAGEVNRTGQVGKRQITREIYDRRAALVEHLATPDVAGHAIADHVEALNKHLPDTAAALPGVLARAIRYLSDALPNTPADPITGKKDQASQSEMDAFNLKFDTIEHPESVAYDLARGRITVDQIQTMKAVYPEIYKELQNEVSKQLADHVHAEKNLTFQQRISIGILMDVPTDPSLAKPAMAHATATFGTPPAPPKGGGGGGNGKSQQGAALATPEQKMASGSPGL